MSELDLEDHTAVRQDLKLSDLVKNPSFYLEGKRKYRMLTLPTTNTLEGGACGCCFCICTVATSKKAK